MGEEEICGTFCRCGQALKRISAFNAGIIYQIRCLRNALYLIMKKRNVSGGNGRYREKSFSPGYIFVISDNIDRLYESLKRVIGLTKLIGTGNEIIPLTEEEKSFMIQFGGEEQIVKMSEGIIEGDQIIVLKGPLKGQEGYIRKIDRHKRKAWMEIPMFGRVQNIEIGLEIVSKR